MRKDASMRIKTSDETHPDPIIDPFFEQLFPPLSADALAHLHKSLSVEGQRETIKVWEETGIVLDGHNRLAWCDDAGVEPKIEYLSFPDRDSALDWVLDLAIGRRNLTPLGEAYCLGLRYGRERKAVGRPTNGGKCPQNEDINEGRTGKLLAAESGISKATVERNAAFATGLDKIAEKVGPEYKHAILTRDIKVNKGDVPLLSTATKGQLLAAFGGGADGLKKLVSEIRPAKDHSAETGKMIEVAGIVAFDPMIEIGTIEANIRDLFWEWPPEHIECIDESLDKLRREDKRKWLR